MADCQELQERVENLESDIQQLTELLSEVPPRLRAQIQRQINRLRQQLRVAQRELRHCHEEPVLLQIDGIEVTQAIQDMPHSVTLIAEKRTAVRMYLSYFASPDIQVRGELLARSSTGALLTIASDNQPILSAATAGNLLQKRLDASLSLNFLIPADTITVGNWTFSLHSLVNVTTGVAMPVPGSTSRSAAFVRGAPLRVRVLGVRYPSGSPVQNTPSNLDFSLLFSWLRRAYPVPQVNATHALIDISPTAPAVFSSGDVNAQLAAIRALDVSGGTDRRTHYYGIVSDAGFFMRGSAAGIPGTPDPSTVASGPTGNATWGWDTDGSYGDWYGGHELGHTFGRFHPGSGCGESSDDPAFPYPNGQLANADSSYCGFDVGDPALGIPAAALPGTLWHDVMTYCVRQWLSAYTYDGIRTRLLAEDALPAGPAPGGGGAPDRRFPDLVTSREAMAMGVSLVHVVARVNLTRQEGQIKYVHPIKAQQSEVGTITGRVILRLKNENGELLKDYIVPVKFDSETDTPGEMTGLVDCIMPAHPDAAQVELVIDEKTVDTFQRGRAVREIRNVQKLVEPGALGVVWEHDIEPDDTGMTYVVQASTDEGKTWFTLAVGLRKPEFKFDPKQFPDAKKVYIRIMATNGFTETIASAEEFDL